jgi:hypothetical protein
MEGDNAEVGKAKKAWTELVDAMERGDIWEVERHCTPNGIGGLRVLAKGDVNIAKICKFVAPEFRAVKSNWRRSSDGKTITVNEAGDEGGRFELQKTTDGWKFDQWHQAQ